MAESLQNKSRLLYLEGLRGAAAVYVVMHHAMMESDLTSKTLAQKILVAAFKHGHYAVNLFIVISGFSLMLPVIKKGYEVNSLDFYKRRIRRILPPYYFAIVFSALMIPLYITANAQWSEYISIKSVFTHVFLACDFFLSDVRKINYSLWSIPVECRIYIFFPVLLFVWRKASPWMSLILATVLSIIFGVILIALSKTNPDIDITTSGVNPYIILFTLGMLAADLSVSNSAFANKFKKMPWGLLLLAFLAIFMIYKGSLQYKIGFDENIQNLIEDILFGLVCFGLLCVCSNEKYTLTPLKYFRQAFSWRPLVFLGMFSYSIYLIHVPILLMFRAHVIPLLNLSPATGAMVLIFVGTLVIIGVAYLFFQICEKPFLTKKRKESIVETELVAIDNPAI